MPLTRPKAHQLSGQSAKSSVRVVTTSNVTLSGGAPASVDGVSLTLEDRILVTAQTDATENGIYRVTTVGSGSNGTWIRSRDANQNEEVLAGMTTMVSEGTTYADTFWKLSTDGDVTLGTTELVFEQHSTVEAKSIANLSDVTLTSTSSNDVLTYNGSAWVNSTSIDLSGNIDGANINVDDTLRIAQSGSGLRMTNVGAFDNDGSDNFRVFATNDLILAANGESGTAITIDATNQDVAVSNDLTVSGELTVDTNTFHVDPTNNRVGIGTTTPAYQVEIENTGSNALLVLDRTDGASTFIEGGASTSVLGSVGANDVKIAYNSVPVVTIGAGGAITTSGNITGGNLRADNLTTQNAFAIVGSDNNLIQDTTLSVDPASNFLGINQTSPEVTLHMTGEGAQTAQIRMEQYNDSADAPDVRTRRYRGTIASPSAVQSGDYLFRSNHEYYNGTSLLVGGAFAFDNTNNANRTQFSVAVDIDGTGADPQGTNGQFKIDGNDNGAITFNNAYKFPTADGSAGQVLQTDGSGALSFVTGAGNVFTTIAVSGQSDIVADSSTDTLTLAAGTGITLTTDAGTDTLTITAESADFPFAQDGDFESVTDDPASESEDLGDLDSTNATTYDLGTIISAEGLIYPGQLVLPQYETASLPDATVEGQLAYDTDTNSVKFTNGSEWAGYAGTASPTFTGTASFANITQTDTSSIQSQSEGNYAQKRYILHGTTTDATETEIFVGGVASSRIPIATDTTVTADAMFTARRTDATGHSAGFKISAVADNFSGTSADVGSVYEITIADDTGALAVDIQADDTTDSLKVLVQGEAGKTISWMCVVNTVEVSQ